MQPDVSIIIPSWNTCALLRDCLYSVQTAGGGNAVRLEVIVVDNASHDGSAELVAASFPSVRLLRNSVNLGFARACNQGIAAATGRYLLLLNSDTLAIDQTFEHMVRFADARPQAAVVGCRVLRPNGSLQPSCLLFPSVFNLLLWCFHLPELFPGSRLFGRALFTWWPHDHERVVDAVQGSCLLARRDVVQQIGALDSSYFMYCEETDWCWRMKYAGWQVVFSPSARIIHFGGASSARMPVAMTLQLLGSHLLFLRKNRGRFSYLTGCLVVALLCALRALPSAIAAAVRPARRAQAWNRAAGLGGGLWRVLTRGAEGLFYRPVPQPSQDTPATNAAFPPLSGVVAAPGDAAVSKKYLTQV